MSAADAAPTPQTRAADGGLEGRHLSTLELEQLFFEKRNAYLVDLPIGAIWERPVIPMVRELLTRFEAEVLPGEHVDVTTRIVSRSRRSFVMEQTIELRDRVAASSRTVHVCVDLASGRAAPVPDDLWAAIEATGERRVRWETRLSAAPEPG